MASDANLNDAGNASKAVGSEAKVASDANGKMKNKPSTVDKDLVPTTRMVWKVKEVNVAVAPPETKPVSTVLITELNDLCLDSIKTDDVPVSPKTIEAWVPNSN